MTVVGLIKPNSGESFCPTKPTRLAVIFPGFTQATIVNSRKPFRSFCPVWTQLPTPSKAKAPPNRPSTQTGALTIVP